MSGEKERSTGRCGWLLPDITKVFDAPQPQHNDDTACASVIDDTLASFGVGARVTHVEHGPAITRYEVKPERGVRVARITSLSEELAVALGATSVQIEAPIPGKPAVGIEVPNSTISIVAIRGTLEHIPRGLPPLSIALGKDRIGRPVFGDLCKMPHLLAAGTTGSGKSHFLRCIIASLLVTATPDEVELLMIDPKRVELTVYNGIPHLKNEVITDPAMAVGALTIVTREMDVRHERFARASVRNIEEYNAKFPGEKLPYVVVIIDELADLMLIGPAKIEILITRLGQHAAASGIHLVVTTSALSSDIITSSIKANIPSRVAFAVVSRSDSRTILGVSGAECLLGRGDMLFLPIDAPAPIRAQAALATSAEIANLVAFWKAQAPSSDTTGKPPPAVRVGEDFADNERAVDVLWYDAAKFLLDSRIAKGDACIGSTAVLQTRFGIGHPRAVRLMRELEELGIVGPNEGTKPRIVLIGSPADLGRIADRIGRPAQTDLFAG